MALTSPGVEVLVIDESQYIPSAVNTVPYFLIATAQNKADAAGVGVAAGTTAANANKTYLITSQRDLAATFGVPFFYNTTTGTPINGYELNEYGLLAAYSSLGVTNRAYIQRVDIDLTELTASLSRPTGTANNGTYWLDTSITTWGVFQWNQTTGAFTNQVPIVITDSANVVNYDGGDYTPLTTIGSIGDYAVSAVSLENPMYYKNMDNVWVFVGSDDWKLSWPTIQGTVSNPDLTGSFGYNMYINGNLVAVPGGETVSAFSTAINVALPYGTYGFYTDVVDGKLTFYADSTATNDGSSASGGIVSITPGPNNGTALLVSLGISGIEYLTPGYLPGYSYQAPRWGTSQPTPHPTGSVWQNISAANNGMSLRVKTYNAALGTWLSQTTNVYVSDAAANYAIDPSGGGKNIPVGTTYAIYNAMAMDWNPSSAFQIFERTALGATVVTGSVLNPTFVNGNQFDLAASVAGSSAYTTYTVTLAGTTPAAFVNAVSAAAIPYVSASVSSAGAIVLTHSQGGTMLVTNVTGVPLTTAGFTDATTYVHASNTTAGQLVLSNWVTSPEFTYTASTATPDQNPANGRLWYYSSVSDVDIMIQNNGAWVGYQNVSNDTRGFDLMNTNASGPIVAATAPTTENNAAQSPLEYGDLWVDTSDLENYPKLYRWAPVTGQPDQWVEIDTTDQVTSNGILFADARWSTSGATNPVTDPLPTIESLLTSDHLDLDAPDPALYPQGMLLWNTRRSGYNVKQFKVNYFNTNSFPDQSIPEQTNAWVTVSGNQPNGAAYMGRKAQRAMVVKSLRASIDTNTSIREEDNYFNLMATPNYPELQPNMIVLNYDRDETGYIIGDTPLGLADDATAIQAWATNAADAASTGEEGLVTRNTYLGLFYPSGLANDLSGNQVVVPPSHMMLRTFLRNDTIAYPWLAAAGTRRGNIENALSIGYLNRVTGEFQPTKTRIGIRDTLYINFINPLVFFTGVGLLNYGNKNSYDSSSALDRTNVARLVNYIRRQLTIAARPFVFEPNDAVTRSAISAVIQTLLVDLVAKRGLYDYLVQCDTVNNTPARIDRNELWVDVAIEPVKAAEFIYIPVRVMNTGAIAAQISGK